MTGLDDIKTTFFEECGELTGTAGELLARMAEGAADSETLHAIFRAVHSIKGGAGAFGFGRLVAFTHVFETVLDGVRDGRLVPEPALVQLLQRANDTLADLIGDAREGETLPASFGAETEAALEAYARRAAGGSVAEDVAAAAPAAARASTAFCIAFRPRAQMFRNANEPLLILAQLRRLGTLEVAADASRLPDIHAMDAEDAYVSWQMTLTTDAGRDAVAEAFEFVLDDCDLEIGEGAPAEGAGAARAALAPAPPQADAAPKAEARPLAAASPTIRVDIEKIDRLVNLVGELVITQSVLMQQSATLDVEHYPDLLRAIDVLSQHARELQESVMAIRAQPVKSVFARMPRLVRDLAAELGKDVRIVMTGETTEIDKTVIEQLGDPLTHMIRNALDHGIEPPGERVARGKPPQGTIHLSAEHRGGRIIIEISDDGRGIDREQVRRKAVAKGLIAPTATLSDAETDNLIFLPGFSTADKVSSVSGRGVGMDVVKRNVQGMGGRVSLESRFGQGSRFVLSLPLTLAILDGMVVAVGRETYILPLTAIVESLRPRAADIHPLVGVGDVLAIRGDYVKLLYLHRAFHVAGAVTDPTAGIAVIVEQDGGQRLALVVDELLGQQQVVVKSIEANYAPVDGIGGATILGDGRVALILDISRLAESAACGARPETGTRRLENSACLH